MSYWPKYANKQHAPLLFVHIPKTAGLSVQQWYRKTYGKFEKCMHGSLSHPTLETINNRIESFCVVRNPYDLVYSWYRYKRQMLGEKRHADGNELAAWERGFDYWLEHYFDKVNLTTDKSRPGEFNKISPCFNQSSYLKDSQGQFAVNYVLKFETLDQDFRIIQSLTNSTNNLGFENKTSVEKRDYRTVYTVQSRRIVDRVYGEDLDRFQYTF